MAISAIKTLL